LNWWQAIILGLVEGITEYLPVSSTGHLIITSSLLGLDTDESIKSQVDAFNIVIQGGAILAVLAMYWPSVLRMLKGLIGKDPGGFRLMLLLIVAFLPAAVLGVLLDDWIESKLFSTWPVLAALALGGVYMIALDKLRKKRDGEAQEEQPLESLSFKSALFIGFMQCIAMWPGTSRSMMTITAGVIAGLKPARAAEFSFLLGLPTLGGACVYKLAKNLAGDGPNMFEVIGIMPIAIGIIVATISAAISVKWLVGFLNKHGLAPFGWYRLVLTAVLGTLVLTGFVTVGADSQASEDNATPTTQQSVPPQSPAQTPDQGPDPADG